MKTSKEALATHLGWDYKDLADYNYQPGRFTSSVYTVGSDYYCCVKSGQSVPQPKSKNRDHFKWVEIADNYCNKYGFRIYKATP